MYNIPLFELNFDTAEEQAALNTIQSRWISMGEQVKALESHFSERLNVKHCVAVTNCTSALHLALASLDLNPDDEVIVPSLTFVASANVIRYVGATPVFADIHGPHDLSIDPDDIERKITPQTKAIIVVHYGGFACDMKRIRAIADRYQLALIEDAAHTPDLTVDQQKCGTFGYAGCLSFFSNKNVTCAEGGMVLLNDDDVAQRVRLMRSHGMTTLSFDRAKGHATAYDVVELGFNYRMDDVRASIMIAQMAKFDDDQQRRRKLREYYIQCLNNVDGVDIPYKNVMTSNNYIFPIVLKEADYHQRDTVRAALAEAGVQTSVHYPAIHRFSIYKDYYVSLPKTEYVTDCLITLPMYGQLRFEHVDHIVSVLKKALHG